jgi:hypothetical protein
LLHPVTRIKLIDQSTPKQFRSPGIGQVDNGTTTTTRIASFTDSTIRSSTISFMTNVSKESKAFLSSFSIPKWTLTVDDETERMLQNNDFCFGLLQSKGSEHSTTYIASEKFHDDARKPHMGRRMLDLTKWDVRQFSNFTKDGVQKNKSANVTPALYY